MRDFSYARADSRADAVALAQFPDTAVLAGGTELLNWTRIGIAEPARVVDITRVRGMAGVETLPGGGVRIGALTKLNDAAQHRLIREAYPVLSEAPPGRPEQLHARYPPRSMTKCRSPDVLVIRSC